ncbi:bifunctional 2',3'-cyclic-nucleotide 2'-phosphodiesterase/3'-nucleotidase [Mangrovicoccus sp. HB161399]|uniref:bifunctional 2',3'-cyclic-nucleotide 2'-phosphodiesterase/3'-nucleotidase n=1 Tax=Mangrovicoccus sp. HB161399 TaxID=2720392 RepID=UPI001553CAC8
MTQIDLPPGNAGRPRLGLRLLGISDLHAHLRAHDYDTGRSLPAAGLTRVATLVREARADGRACLLFDNGDTLQGTALGDWAAVGEGGDAPHPVIDALNRLGVDAATPGNHDFNFGLPFLQRAAGQAAYPLVCANVLTRRGTSPAEDETLLPPWTILERDIADGSGRMHRLKIGVTGVVPPQIMDWDRRILHGRVSLRGIREAVEGHLPAIRRAGADIVVVLSHSGLGENSEDPRQEQAAAALARLDGIDAIIAGHSHCLFPPPGQPAGGVRVHGTPLVQPGFWGSHLGVIDLDLEHDGARWQVAGTETRLMSVADASGAPVPEDPEIVAASEAAHAAAMAWLDRPVGQSPVRLHSFFSLIGPDAAQQAVAEAQAAALAELIRDTGHAGLPLLSAVSPFKCGGKAGPHFYTDVPAGPLSLRHVTDLYLYPNSLSAALVTGAMLRDWLERAASIFAAIAPGERRRTLVAEGQPGYEFDTLFGASYQIDLSAPARYDPATGALADPGASRVRDLRAAGRPVADADRFVVATNNYRTGGGGNYPGLGPGAVIAEASTPVREILARHLAAAPARPLADPPWSFAPVPGASAVLATSPRARGAPEELARAGLADLGDREDGFALFELDLGRGTGFSGRLMEKQSAR